MKLHHLFTLFLAAMLQACAYTGVQTGEVSRTPAAVLDKKTVQKNIKNGLCMKLVDNPATPRITLKGRLGVTYVDQRIDEKKGDQHELGVFDLTRPQDGVRLLTRNLINESEVEIHGNKMLYNVRPKLDGFEGNSELWQVNMDGTNPEFLVGGGSVGVPAWINPDGKKMLYIKWGKNTDSELFIMDTTTKAITPFLKNLRGAADPEVSDDGTLITFKMAVKGDRQNQPSIYVMKADGSAQRRLTRGYSDHDPVFSRDGKKIYFERYYGPGDWFQASQDRGEPENNIWGNVEVDVETGAEKIITPYDPCGRHFFWLPTVSPDGKYLMYVHIDVKGETEGKPWTDLWVSKIDGSDPQKVPGSDWMYFFDWAE